MTNKEQATKAELLNPIIGQNEEIAKMDISLGKAVNAVVGAWGQTAQGKCLLPPTGGRCPITDDKQEVALTWKNPSLDLDSYRLMLEHQFRSIQWLSQKIEEREEYCCVCEYFTPDYSYPESAGDSCSQYGDYQYGWDTHALDITKENNNGQ